MIVDLHIAYQPFVLTFFENGDDKPLPPCLAFYFIAGLPRLLAVLHIIIKNKNVTLVNLVEVTDPWKIQRLKNDNFHVLFSK
jgi:hypothetical protein